jgi:hypothetical protein
LADPVTREREAIALLEAWPWESGTTVIGGYALAAYGAARHSVDIDFTLSSRARPEVTEWLEEREFRKRSLNAAAFQHVLRFERGDVCVDLLVDFVRDRHARVNVPEPWIAARPRRTPLVLLTGRVHALVRVARPEALWALKLQSGRPQDLTDLFAISEEPVAPEEVFRLFCTLMTPSLAAKLDRVLAALESPKIYNDSRSRLGLRDEPTVRDRWTRFLRRASSMVPHESPSSV